MNPLYRKRILVVHGGLALLGALIALVETRPDKRPAVALVVLLVWAVALVAGNLVAASRYRRRPRTPRARDRVAVALAIAAGASLGPLSVRLVPPATTPAVLVSALFAFFVGMALRRPPEGFDMGPARETEPG